MACYQEEVAMASDPKFAVHRPMEARHRDEPEWETIRWPGETGKMVFHPRPQRPAEVNAGILRLEPSAYNPPNYHDFAQVWYILEGTSRIGGRDYRPGTMIFHRDPRYEDEFHTERSSSFQGHRQAGGLSTTIDSI
jgi:hypothetical protein